MYMELQKTTSFFNLRLLKKLLSLLFLVCVAGSNFSCKSKTPEADLRVSDAVREDQAKEILKSKYKKQNFAEFKGDEMFSQYVKLYLQKVNPELGNDTFLKTIFSESKNYHYDPVFLMAVIKTESQFNVRRIGSAGEIGLMQIKPSTAKWICQKKGLTWKGNSALKDPSYNVKVSALYFKYLKKSLHSNSNRYINAYNMGIGKLTRLPASGISAHPYYYKVINNYTEIYSELKKIKSQVVASKS